MNKLFISLFSLSMFFGAEKAHSQTINIGPNQYAFRFSVNPNYGLFFNSTAQRYEFLNGTAQPVFGFDANNGRMTTNLEFNPGSDYVVGPNRYAFRSPISPNVGLFATNSAIQFLGVVGNPLFSINLGNGNIASQGALTVGNTTSNVVGTIRYNGSDIEGNLGSGWISLTQGSIPGPEGPAGPQGPTGPQGATGATGPQGTSGIITSGFSSSGNPLTLPNTSATFFISPTATVTTTSSSQCIFITGSKALGTTLAGGASGLGLYVGYRTSGSTSDPFAVGGGMLGLRVTQNTRVVFTNSGRVCGLAPGTYEVGLVGVISSTNAPSWNSNEWGYTTALVYEQGSGSGFDGAMLGGMEWDAQEVDYNTEERLALSMEMDNAESVSSSLDTPGHEMLQKLNDVLSENELIKAENEQIKSLLHEVLQRINTLDGSMEQCCFGQTGQIPAGGSTDDRALLEQNIPNPFDQTTTIRYYLPANTANAQLIVHDASGRQLYATNLGGTGAGQVEINTAAFSTGVYFYTLMANGEKVATRKMMLNR